MNQINKNNIKLSLLIILLISLTLGGTYAFLNYSASSDTAQGTGGCFQVNYSGTVISDLGNNIVQSNETGAATDLATGSLPNANSTVTLSKASSCKIYTEAKIYIHTNEETTAPIEGVQAFKYKITQGSNTIETGVINKKGDFLLTTVPITDSALTYNIYLWIDSAISGGAYNSTTFSGKIFAESSQTSTIENTHMLSFSATGSDKLPDRVVTLNQNYGTLPTPSKTGYTFQGWNGKNILNYNKVLSEAQATGITVDSNGNISDSSPTSDSRGWLSISQLNWRQYLSTGTYTMRIIFSTKATNSSAQSYGQYRISKISNNAVAQQIDGGSTYNVDSITKTFTLNTDTEIGITVKGYDGIYKIQIEKENTATDWEPYLVTSTTPVTQNKNHTLTAIWSPVPYTVTLAPNGGNVTPTTMSVNYGEKYGTLPTPYKSGYTFKGWSELPADYQQLEHIESNGTQYINTGYYWTHENIEIIFDGTVLANPSSQSLFGNEEYIDNSARNFAGIPHGSNGNYGIYLGNGNQGNITTSVGTRFNLRIKTTTAKQISVYKDGNQVFSKTYQGSVLTKNNAYTTSTSSTTVGHIFLFSNHNTNKGTSNNATQLISAMRVHSFKLIDNNVITRDMIPCYKISTGKAGMYDIANNVFYPNSATSGADFTRGDNKYITKDSAVTQAKNHTLTAIWEAN